MRRRPKSRARAAAAAEYHRDAMAGVSVIITAHDEAAFLGAAIDRVLAQELPADEILVVDERGGLQWFADRLAARGPQPLPPEIVAALEERLERNVRQFGEALPERPELGEHASLYAPAALDRLRAGLGALRA